MNIIGFPNIISFECILKIIEQMKKSICKITNNSEQGTGFFCKIPFPNKNKELPVLITNNHIIDDNLLNKNSKITIKIKDDPEQKNLRLGERMKYTNKDNDITIIEIKKEDQITNFLELDEKIIKDILNDKNENNEYKDETIYIIQYPEGKLSISFGILKDIYVDKKYIFNHLCSTRAGSSGAPILNLDNKIIGIHSKSIESRYNCGIFLNYSIKEFIRKYSIKTNYKKQNNDNKLNNNDKKQIIVNKNSLNNKQTNEIKNKSTKSIKKINNTKSIIKKPIKIELKAKEKTDGVKQNNEKESYYNDKINFDELIEEINDIKNICSKLYENNSFEQAISKYKIGYEKLKIMIKEEKDKNPKIKELLIKPFIQISFGLSRCYFKIKKYEESIKIDKEIINIDKNFDESYNRLFQSYLKLNKIQDVLHFGELLLKFDEKIKKKYSKSISEIEKLKKKYSRNENVINNENEISKKSLESQREEVDNNQKENNEITIFYEIKQNKSKEKINLQDEINLNNSINSNENQQRSYYILNIYDKQINNPISPINSPQKDINLPNEAIYSINEEELYSPIKRKLTGERNKSFLSGKSVDDTVILDEPMVNITYLDEKELSKNKMISAAQRSQVFPQYQQILPPQTGQILPQYQQILPPQTGQIVPQYQQILPSQTGQILPQYQQILPPQTGQIFPQHQQILPPQTGQILPQHQQILPPQTGQIFQQNQQIIPHHLDHEPPQYQQILPPETSQIFAENQSILPSQLEEIQPQNILTVSTLNSQLEEIQPQNQSNLVVQPNRISPENQSFSEVQSGQIFESNHSIIEDQSKSFSSKNNSINNRSNSLNLEDKIYLFNPKFVENNKDNCYLLINGEKHDLSNFLYLNENLKSKDRLEIKLIKTKPIVDMSYMFSDCETLITLLDISKWDTKKVKNMRNMFNGCRSLTSIPDISDWNTENVSDMGGMFYNCFSLKSLPDISKWDIKNVTNMEKMFYNCKSLISLPDISKWKLNKNLKKDSMFTGVNKKIIPKKFNN